MDFNREALLDYLPQWEDVRSLTITFIPQGMTNDNYRIDVDGQTYVFRLGRPHAGELGIERSREAAAHQVATQAGLAPPIYEVVRPEGYLVTHFVEGTSLPPDALQSPETLTRVVDLLKQVHQLPPIDAHFSPFRAIERYEQVIRRHRLALPLNFTWLFSQLKRIETALARNLISPCLCHNEPLHSNFLVTADRLLLLDWEYAGMGDPFFDLACLAVTHNFPLELEDNLLTRYFETPTNGHWTRFRLQKLVVDFFKGMQTLVWLTIHEEDAALRREEAFAHFNQVAQTIKEAPFEEWLREGL